MIDVDRVDREKLWNILKENGYPLHLFQAIQSLCNETEILIDLQKALSEAIIINQGVK